MKFLKSGHSNTFYIFNLGLLAFLFIGLNAESKIEACQCKQYECGPCEVKVGETFYSENCDKNQVRSCKKPKCEPLKDKELTDCRAQLNAHGVGDKGFSSKSEESVNTQTEIKKVKVIASTGNKVGVVAFVNGDSWVTRKDGEKNSCKVGFQLQEQDIIETGEKGRVKVMFQDKSTLLVSPKTRIQIVLNEEKSSNGENKTLLHMMYGKIRNKVTKNYDGDKNSFKVKTAAAVAGVRGTDFITSFVKDEQGHYSMRVETLTGEVELKGNFQEDKKVLIHKGEKASFIVEGVDQDLFSNDDIGKFITKGYLTPVNKLSDHEIRELVNESLWDSERTVASKDQNPICHEPNGYLNQCSWVCKNNPKGEKTCRTDLPNVDCLRYKCNANGKWAEEYRLPASYHENCHAHDPKVGGCDY